MKLKLKVTKHQILNWLLFAYLARKAIRLAISLVLARFGFGWFVTPLTLFIIFAPLVFLWLLHPSELKNAFPFFCVLAITAFLFFLTLTIHPEYRSYYYDRGNLSVNEAVFDLYSGGLICFLVFLLQEDPEQTMKSLHAAAFLIMLYSIYTSVRAEGIWMAYNAAGDLVEQDYGLNFGYEIMFGAIIFLYMFFKNRKWYDLICFAVSFYVSFSSGSRGSNLCLAVFIALYFLEQIRKKPLLVRLLILAALAAVYIISDFYWDTIYSGLMLLMNRTNLQSRTIQMLLTNNILSDSGRSDIYRISWNAIRQQGFFGYGVYGSRPIIAPSYYWGYPHNIALEFIMEFGWLFGVLLLALLIRGTAKAVSDQNNAVSGLFCILTAMTVKLFVSDSFWQYPFFWGLVGGLFAYLRWKKHAAVENPDTEQNTLIEKRPLTADQE